MIPKISGSSCATTGSRTGFSNPTTTSSITVASPGTSLSTCPGKLCLSEFENGPIGLDQRDLVSAAKSSTTPFGSDWDVSNSGREACDDRKLEAYEHLSD